MEVNQEREDGAPPNDCTSMPPHSLETCVEFPASVSILTHFLDQRVGTG